MDAEPLSRPFSNAAKARHRPTTDRAQMQSHAPGDRPAQPLQGRTNKTADLDLAPTAPSWLDPAADRVNVRESLFAATFNGLLQQNLPEAAVHSIRLECALTDRSASGRGSAGTVLGFSH